MLCLIRHVVPSTFNRWTRGAPACVIDKVAASVRVARTRMLFTWADSGPESATPGTPPLNIRVVDSGSESTGLQHGRALLTRRVVT